MAGVWRLCTRQALRSRAEQPIIGAGQRWFNRMPQSGMRFASSGVSAMPLHRFIAHLQHGNPWLCLACLWLVAACQADDRPTAETSAVITADFTLRDDQTHNKFSRSIEPAIRVPSVTYQPHSGNCEGESRQATGSHQ